MFLCYLLVTFRGACWFFNFLWGGLRNNATVAAAPIGSLLFYSIGICTSKQWGCCVLGEFLELQMKKICEVIHLFPLQQTLLSEVCCIMYWEYRSVAREITTISRCFRDYILTALQDEGWGCGNEDLLMKQGSCVLQALVYTFQLSVKRDECTLQKAKYFTVFLCCIFPCGLWYLTGKHLVYFQHKYRHKVCTDP